MLLIKQVIFILVIIVSLSACADQKAEPEIYLIPEGYVGSFFVVYDVKSGQEPEYENGARLFRLSKKSVFHTQLPDNAVAGYPNIVRFFYVSNDGTRTEIIDNYGTAVEDTSENRSDKKIYVMGGGFGEFGFNWETMERGCKYTYQSFYVGTLSNRLEGDGNFWLDDYYEKHDYPCP